MIFLKLHGKKLKFFQIYAYKCSLSYLTLKNMQFTKFNFICISCNYPFNMTYESYVSCFFPMIRMKMPWITMQQFPQKTSLTFTRHTGCFTVLKIYSVQQLARSFITQANICPVIMSYYVFYIVLIVTRIIIIMPELK